MQQRLVMLLTIGLVLALSLCGVLAYLWIDGKVSQAYADRAYERDAGYRAMASLLESEWKGITKDELFEKLQAHAASAKNKVVVLFYDDETDTIVFDTVVFEIDNGRFNRIRREP